MTAPITLFTGKPGAGKTAQLVAEILKMQKEEEGRPIFALGINGLRADLAAELSMDQLYKWWELPPGSIVCIDECQEEHLMPRDRGTPAAWVQRLAKVRHYGMSFLLTTQHPANISSFVRRLVGRHVHTVRKFQTGVIQLFVWEGCADDPESRAARKQATETVGTLPKEVFDLYKSSQLHTMKKRLPRKVYLFFVLVVIALAAAVSVPFVLKHAQAKNESMISGRSSVSTADAVQPVSSSVADADLALRQSDPANWMTPRVEGMPWTAPMFDDLRVTAHPRLFCIAAEDSCICNTEQGTRYAVAQATCRVIATNGVYDPFRASQREERRDADLRPDQAQPPAGGRPPAAVGVPGPQTERATAAPYAPPTYVRWDADAVSKHN